MGGISVMLEGMGSTPEQVAATVRRERVQGMRDSSSFMNPIVRYLNRILDLGGKLEVACPRVQSAKTLDTRSKPPELPPTTDSRLFLDKTRMGEPRCSGVVARSCP